MANQHITQLVNDLIQRGRIQESMKDQYINLLAASPQLEEEFSSMLLRGSDYTRKTQELAEQRRQAEQTVAAERERVLAERSRLQQWERTVQGQLTDYDKVVKDLPNMTGKIAAYEQMLKDHELNGRPMIDYVNVPSTTTTTTGTHPPTTTTRPMNTNPNEQVNAPYLKKEEAAGALRDLVVLQEKVDAIKAKHFQLFGEYLTDNLVSHSLTTGEDPEQHWKVKHNVDAKVAELGFKQREAEVARIREEERTKLMQEMALDPSRVVGGPRQPGGLTPLFEQYGHSKALQHAQPHANDNAATGDPRRVPPEMKNDIPSSQERVSAAVNRFLTNFDPNTAQPISEDGRRMHNKYAGIGTE